MKGESVLDQLLAVILLIEAVINAFLERLTMAVMPSYRLLAVALAQMLIMAGLAGALLVYVLGFATPGLWPFYLVGACSLVVASMILDFFDNPVSQDRMKWGKPILWLAMIYTLVLVGLTLHLVFVLLWLLMLLAVALGLFTTREHQRTGNQA